MFLLKISSNHIPIKQNSPALLAITPSVWFSYSTSGGYDMVSADTAVTSYHCPATPHFPYQSISFYAWNLVSHLQKW